MAIVILVAFGGACSLRLRVLLSEIVALSGLGFLISLGAVNSPNFYLYFIQEQRKIPQAFPHYALLTNCNPKSH